jgi:hypothetical protein
MKKRVIITIACVALITLINTTPTYCQRAGDFWAGWGISLPGGFFFTLQYFPINYVSLEIRGGGLVHMLFYSARMNIHTQFDRPHVSFFTGITGASAGRTPSNIDSLAADSLVRVYGEGTHLVNGAGLLFGSSDYRYDLKVGASYPLSQTYHLMNRFHQVTKLEIRPEEFAWGYMFEGSDLSYPRKKK